MRKILVLAFLFTLSLSHAQTDTSYWSNGGTFGINGSQTSFVNWATGGDNQIAIVGSVNLFANYLKGNKSWANTFIGNLGYSRQGKQSYRKGDDKIEFNTNYGIKAAKHWYYSALLNFKSQFAKGYNYTSDTSKTFTSEFLAPAYVKVGIGMNYKPNANFNVFLSPATMKYTYVGNQELADEGQFGLTAAVRDTAGNIISHAKKTRTEIGFLARMSYNKDIMKNVNFATTLSLYSNYLKNPQNIDVDWQYLFTFKVNKYLNAQFKGQLIYDDDVKIDIDKNNDGIVDYKAPRTQFTEAFSLGLVYKL